MGFLLTGFKLSIISIIKILNYSMLKLSTINSLQIKHFRTKGCFNPDSKTKLVNRDSAIVNTTVFTIRNLMT